MIQDECRSDAAEAEAIAQSVVEGTDAIAVPEEMLTEVGPAEEAPPKSLWAQIREMNIAQKVKLALRGNKDARAILIRDSNSVIQRMVLHNPRISDEEVLALANDRNTAEDLLRQIAANREWTKSYPIRTALVENARTPVPTALRLLATLADREIGRLAKSKNVPTAIASHARRILFAKLAGRR